MDIWGSMTLDSKPGDFGAEVEDGCLVFPAVLHNLFSSHGLRTAERLLSYAHVFPQAFRTMLSTAGWTRLETTQAVNALLALLRGHIPEEFLEPVEREFPLGAIGPMPGQETPLHRSRIAGVLGLLAMIAASGRYSSREVVYLVRDRVLALGLGSSSLLQLSLRGCGAEDLLDGPREEPDLILAKRLKDEAEAVSFLNMMED